LESVNGVTFLRMENGCAVFILASGMYHFSTAADYSPRNFV
jgi:hypothetical protein